MQDLTLKGSNHIFPLIMISDIDKEVSKSNLVRFADDTRVYKNKSGCN